MLKKPLFVALDSDDKYKIQQLVENLKDHVGGFKVGPRFLLHQGSRALGELSKSAPVFLDTKYYDIPSVMVASLKASFDCGANFVSIHAGCGKEALRAVAQLEREYSLIRPVKILAVTVLTSFAQDSLPAHWRVEKISVLVKKLVQDAYDEGLRGFVCSPWEVEALSQEFSDGYFVTPGIRLSSSIPSDDQRRVITGPEALRRGASALVVGRPIVQAENPIEVIQKIL